MNLVLRVVIAILVLAGTLLAPLATPVATASTESTVEASPWIGFPNEYLSNPISGEVSVMWVDGCKVWMSDHNLTGWTTPNHVVNGCSFDAEYADDGTLHLIVDRYSYIDGNWETYHSLRRNQDSEWTLTILVSRTSGDSRYPKLAVWGQHVYATWQDHTPGYWTVYIAQYTDGAVVAMSEVLRKASATAVKPENIQLDSVPLDIRSFWSNGPVPNGRGTMPVIRMNALGEVFLAWQDGGEIWLTAKQQGPWDLPALVSDTPGVLSLDPRFVQVFRPDGVRVMWQEGGDRWYADAWFLNGHVALSDNHLIHRQFIPLIVG